MTPTQQPNDAATQRQPNSSLLIATTAALSCLTVVVEVHAEPNKIHPVADNWVNSCSSGCTANYGTSTEVRVRTAVWSCDVKNFRTLLQFDLSDLPADPNEIAEVTLGLYFYTWHNGDPTGRFYEVYRVINPWSETGSTWQCRDGHSDPNIRVRWDSYLAGVPAYQPGGGDFDANTAYASAEVPPVGNWMTWDVTDLVKEWSAGTHDNFGLIIKDANEYDDPNLDWTDSPLAQFRSADYYSDSFWPYLEIRLVDYTLSITEVHGDWGDVVLDPEPNDPNTPVTYPAYTRVTLEAQPIEGKSFKHWELYDPNFPGDANHASVDSNHSVTIVMDADREVTAVFKCGSGVDLALPLAGTMLALAGAGALRFRSGRARIGSGGRSAASRHDT